MNDPIIIEAPDTHRASVIWLHGLGADGHDFEPIVPELGLPPELGIRFVFPNAPIRPVTINGGMEMRSWYDIKNPDLGVERERTDFDESADILSTLIMNEVELGIEPANIVVAGFSQGGAIALHCGLNFPQTLAGMLILSSYLPFSDVLDSAIAQHNSQTPILMMHGEFDPVIPIDFSRRSAETLKEKGYLLDWHTFPMQHSVCAEEINITAEWLKKVLAI